MPQFVDTGISVCLDSSYMYVCVLAGATSEKCKALLKTGFSYVYIYMKMLTMKEVDKEFWYHRMAK